MPTLELENPVVEEAARDLPVCYQCGAGIEGEVNNAPGDPEHHKLCDFCIGEVFVCGHCSLLCSCFDSCDVDGTEYCYTCYDREFEMTTCGHRVRRGQAHSHTLRRGAITTYCNTCWENTETCSGCQNRVQNRQIGEARGIDGTIRRECSGCRSNYQTCYSCQASGRYLRHDIQNSEIFIAYDVMRSGQHNSNTGRFQQAYCCHSCARNNGLGEPVEREECGMCHSSTPTEMMFDGRSDGTEGRYCYRCAGYRIGSDLRFWKPGSNCEPKHLEFDLEFPGAHVKSDEKFRLELASGEISKDGQGRIKVLLDNNDLPYKFLNKDWEWQWQTKEGNLTKRISRWLHKNEKIKLSPSLVSEIGNICAQATDKDAHTWLEFTGKMNESPAFFFHEKSCWWTCYKSSRCYHKQNGGIAIRAFDDNERLKGRVWLQPVRLSEYTTGSGTNFRRHIDFSPSLTDCNGWLLFNGYGLETRTFARYMAQIAGMSYAYMRFIPRCNEGTMYINCTREHEGHDGVKTQSYLVSSPALLQNATIWEASMTKACGCVWD